MQSSSVSVLVQSRIVSRRFLKTTLQFPCVKLYRCTGRRRPWEANKSALISHIAARDEVAIASPRFSVFFLSLSSSSSAFDLTRSFFLSLPWVVGLWHFSPLFFSLSQQAAKPLLALFLQARLMIRVLTHEPAYLIRRPTRLVQPKRGESLPRRGSGMN